MGNFIALTSQGIAFIHAGQERGRTKPKKNATTTATGSDEVTGNFIRNSYDASDDINGIDWSTLDEDYQGLLDYTKGLAALRTSEKAFRLGTKTLVKNNINQITTDSKQNMVYYIIDPDTSTTYWIVAMNGSSTDSMSIATGITGTYEIYVDGSSAGTTAITGSAVTVSGSTVTVPALTCAVLKVTDGSI